MHLEQCEKIQSLLPKIEIPKELKVLSRIRDSQYICWEYITDEFTEAVLMSRDIVEALLDFESKDDFNQSNLIISHCQDHEKMQQDLLLFTQSINSFREERYNLSAIGITAIIDSVLSKTTGILSNKPLDRCKALLDKLERDGTLEQSEYTVMLLYYTFYRMMDSFYSRIDFAEQEPLNLNRNWLMHGRVKRELTKTECIKLIRFLYSILLISDLAENVNIEDQPG